MGTMATIEVGIDTPPIEVLARIESHFEAIENRFSLYRPDSELNRVAADTLSLMDSSPELREVYADALRWRNATNGAFTPHRPDGVIDLDGIVKAVAIDRAGAVLDEAGLGDWCVNVGGDILCRGTQSDGNPWTIGIVDPADRQSLLCSIVLAVGRRAVATSGRAERGDHIWRDGRHTDAQFRQVTVVADDIITADVLATAIVSGGSALLDEITEHWSVDVLTVDSEGSLRATPGFRAALAV